MATLTTQLYDAVPCCEQKVRKFERVEVLGEHVARFTQTLLALRSGLAAEGIRSRSVEPIRQSSRLVSKP